MSGFTDPPPVEPGDHVAVVAPASGLAAEYPHVYQRGLQQLRERFDLHPVEYPTATADDEYLAAHPEARAEDVMDAFRDPEVGAVLTTIGGNDQVRILKHLDPDVLRANPTRFFGISDNTNLACYLWNRGIVSYYGGTVLTTLANPGGVTDYSAEHLRRALFEETIGEVEPAERFTDEDLDWADPENLDRSPEYEPNPGWTWTGGDVRAEGRIWGGCLSVVHSFLAADRFAPAVEDLAGAILLLETSEWLPSAEVVRSALHAMGERGILEAIDGVIVGRGKARSHVERRDAEARAAFRERQREVVETVVGEYNPDAPIVLDFDVGHTEPEVPVPVGGRAVVDPDQGRVAFP